MYSNGPPHMSVQKQDDQHEYTFSNYVRIQDVVQKTCLRRWTIGKSGERGSGISVLPAQHDDDDDFRRTRKHLKTISSTEITSNVYHMSASPYKILGIILKKNQPNGRRKLLTIHKSLHLRDDRTDYASRKEGSEHVNTEGSKTERTIQQILISLLNICSYMPNHLQTRQIQLQVEK